MNEDVSPIKNGDFPAWHVTCSRGYPFGADDWISKNHQHVCISYISGSDWDAGIVWMLVTLRAWSHESHTCETEMSICKPWSSSSYIFGTNLQVTHGMAAWLVSLDKALFFTPKFDSHFLSGYGGTLNSIDENSWLWKPARYARFQTLSALNGLLLVLRFATWCFRYVLMFIYLKLDVSVRRLGKCSGILEMLEFSRK